jgi:hypothetical protein
MRRFAIACDWHGFPLRVLAPQRFAQCISTQKRDKKILNDNYKPD